MSELFLEAMSTMEFCFAIAISYALGSLLMHFGIPVWPMAAIIIAGIIRIAYFAYHLEEEEEEMIPKSAVISKEEFINALKNIAEKKDDEDGNPKV